MAINALLLFKVIVIFTTIQRLFELYLSKKNESKSVAQGAMVVREKNYIFMVLLHSCWLVTLFVYSFFYSANLSFKYFLFFLILFLIGQCLRISTILTLGQRWTTKIVIWPKSAAINDGVFKFMRHPNYLGVIFEIIALPMMAGLFKLALVFSVFNGLILFFRIRLEEKYLKKYNNYSEIFNLNE